MSIKDFFDKIKSVPNRAGGTLHTYLTHEIAVIIVIILVGTASFGLGRMSAVSNVKVPIKITEGYPPASQLAAPAAELASAGTPSGGVVASKSSKKYHYPWCTGAKQISTSNKIVFASATEAEKAGYVKASNCKGL
ncbi:hypothetical protein KW783_00155 [Candidatus Parcubacteria bacterium]|nr:hypothetical protein [Candidatus Parcubacteria bacterium]